LNWESGGYETGAFKINQNGFQPTTILRRRIFVGMNYKIDIFHLI
jgi:hypothetical protein